MASDGFRVVFGSQHVTTDSPTQFEHIQNQYLVLPIPSQFANYTHHDGPSSGTHFINGADSSIFCDESRGYDLEYATNLGFLFFSEERERVTEKGGGERESVAFA